MRRALVVGGWLAGLTLAVVLLGEAGKGALRAPAIDPRSWAGEVEGRGAVEIAFAVLLVLTRAVACYLLGATAFSALASLSGRRWLALAARRVSVPMVERLVAGAVGMAVVGAAAAAGPSAPGGLPRPTVLVASTEGAPAGDPPVMHRLDGPETTVPPPTRPTPDVAGKTWEVGAGDHLWSVAEQVLHDAWGRVPSDGEVAPYWAGLVDDNRAELADPANPDLVFPGQVVTLPAPPAAP